LNVTYETALIYGRTARELRKRGKLIGANDLWIASHALQHQMTLVTANLSHFHHVPGLQLLGY
jgi:tRNA(fMet)-specific endonuclease VapC